MTTDKDKSRGKKEKKADEDTKEEVANFVSDEWVRGHVILEIFASISEYFKN